MRERVINQLLQSGFEAVPVNERGMKLFRYINGVNQHIVWLLEDSAISGMNQFQYHQYVNALRTMLPEGVYSTTIFTVFFSTKHEKCRSN